MVNKITTMQTSINVIKVFTTMGRKLMVSFVYKL